MKTRLKRDLIQGLLTYPAPLTVTPARKSIKVKAAGSKFYQKIAAQMKAPSRLKRKPVIIEPQIIKPDSREAIWQNLRREKNL